LRLGLLLGFFLAVFGITGSMLVFYEEIDNVLNADLRIVQAPKQGESAYRALAEIQAAAVAACPRRQNWALSIIRPRLRLRISSVLLFLPLPQIKKTSGRCMLIPIPRKCWASI